MADEKSFGGGSATDEVRSSVAEIFDWLYLSGYRVGRNGDQLRELGITHVLNVTHEHPPPKQIMDSFQVMYCPLPDEDTFDLDSAFKDTDHTRVLVHCTAGMTRSAAIIIHYVMTRCGYNLQQSYDYVRMRKSNIMLTPGFLRQLAAREEAVHGRKLFDLRVFQAKVYQTLTPAQRAAVDDLHTLNSGGGGSGRKAAVPTSVYVALAVAFVVLTGWMLRALRLI